VAKTCFVNINKTMQLSLDNITFQQRSVGLPCTQSWSKVIA